MIYYCLILIWWTENTKKGLGWNNLFILCNLWILRLQTDRYFFVGSYISWIFFLIDFSFNFDTRWCGSNKSQVGVGKSYSKACTKKLESFHQKPYRKFALRVSASELEKLGAILKLVIKSTRSISWWHIKGRYHAISFLLLLVADVSSFYV